MNPCIQSKKLNTNTLTRVFISSVLITSFFILPFAVDAKKTRAEDDRREDRVFSQRDSTDDTQERATTTRSESRGFDYHDFQNIADFFRRATSSSGTEDDGDRRGRNERSDDDRTTERATSTQRILPRATTTLATSSPARATTTATSSLPRRTQNTADNEASEEPGAVMESVVRVLNLLDPVHATGTEYQTNRLRPNATKVLYGTSLALMGAGGITTIRNRKRRRGWLPWILAGIGVFVALFVGYVNSSARQIPIEFSPKVTLDSLWDSYKSTYIEARTGRTIDPSRDSITTSEGQSYTMLRAVWMDDKETFDKAWKWTKDNLRRETDPGISWLFGKTGSGYGVIASAGGLNSATDADVDIALALIFAHKRWNEPAYEGDARVMLDQIWKRDLVIIRGKPYVAASDSESNSTLPVAVNPSYFAPYAYKVFAKFDPSRNWEALVDTSYEILNASTQLPLDKKASAHLPPDWISLNRTTGAIQRSTDPKMTTNYGFDAFRVPWRIALDWQWNKDARARTYLEKLDFLKKEWQEKGLIHTVYSHDGSVVLDIESPGAYGANIGYFLVTDEKMAEEVYKQKLQFLYDPDKKEWKDPLSYYDSNWAWFGIALYNKLLPNLYES